LAGIYVFVSKNLFFHLFIKLVTVAAAKVVVLIKFLPTPFYFVKVPLAN
jgi:hypothetical protein